MPITEIILNTPKWVFILFFILLYLGYTQTKDREISIQKVFILPIIMIIFSIFGIISTFGINFMGLNLWFTSMLVSTIFTIKKIPSKNISYDKNEKTFKIAGSWFPMILIIFIFCIKYIVGFMGATSPEFINNINFIYSISIVYGIISGIFLAKALAILKIKN